MGSFILFWLFIGALLFAVAALIVFLLIGTVVAVVTFGAWLAECAVAAGMRLVRLCRA